MQQLPFSGTTVVDVDDVDVDADVDDADVDDDVDVVVEVDVDIVGVGFNPGVLAVVVLESLDLDLLVSRSNSSIRFFPSEEPASSRILLDLFHVDWFHRNTKYFVMHRFRESGTQGDYHNRGHS